MSKTKQQLENEYLAVKSDIRAHITMIKAYTESIQKSKLKIEELSKNLSALQDEYVKAGYVEGEKDESLHEESTEQPEGN